MRARASLVSPLTRRMTKHIFISYVREDSSEVDKICDTLNAAGVQVWRDKNDIAPGMGWEDAIRQAIDQGSYFMACFSKAYWAKREAYMNTELGYAIERLSRFRDDQAWFIP